MVESITFRSSHRRCSVRKGILKNLAKFTGKHLCQTLIKFLALACNFIEKEALTEMFSCEFCETDKLFYRKRCFYVVSTRSNTALSQEKTTQRSNIPYWDLSKDALTNNHVRCASSNQIIHELNKMIQFSWLIVNLLLEL